MKIKNAIALLGSFAVMGSAAGMSSVGPAWAAATASQLTYIVLYKSNAVSGDAAAAIANAEARSFRATERSGS